MTSAHEQYYTQPEAGTIHITWDAYADVAWKKMANHYIRTTPHEETIYSFGNQTDAYVCRDCCEGKGWRSYWGGPYGSDSIHWEGDFHVIDEEGLEILCDECFDQVTAEPDYGDEPEHEEIS